MPKKTTADTERASATFTRHTAEKMAEVAEELGISKSELTREAVKMYMRAHAYRKQGYEVGAIKEENGNSRVRLFAD